MSLKQVAKNLCPPILWWTVKGIVPPIIIKVAKKAKAGNGEALIKRQVDDILKKQKIIKLHLGCGTVYKDTWINIDNNSDNNIEKIDINYDLRNNLPFPDNSVDFIFNEHFLEHLTVEEGQRSLKDFIRVLRGGGVMRIAMPDLDDTVKAYYEENWKENNREFFEKFGLTFIKTQAERINIGFRWWGHKWLYNFEELERRILEAAGTGCVEIKQCVIMKSDYTELCNLETRKESTLIAEVTKK